MQSRGIVERCQVLYIELHSKTSSPIDHPQKGKVTHGYSKPEDSNKVGDVLCIFEWNDVALPSASRSDRVDRVGISDISMNP